ncbi:DUF87 domain-containing protein [bacterium]|nr:DUF87 domain-containing protein [bacterium]
MNELKFTLGTGITSRAAITTDIHKLIVTRMVIQANSGAGKSRSMRRILEQCFGNAQEIVFDPEGEFVSLAEKFDFLIVGKGGHLPVRVDTAELLALKLRQLGISAVLDLSDLRPLERTAYMKVFLNSLMLAPKAPERPCLVAIDEADMFAPQSRESQSTEAVVDLCVRGRKRGLCPILAVMRLSQLHKDAAAQCNNYLIGRTALDVDIHRVVDILGFQRSRDRVATLKTLKPGEFFFFGPASSSHDVELLKVGDVQTYHPDARAREVKPVSTQSPAVKKALAQLQDLAEEAEEKRQTEQQLRDKIRELETQVRSFGKNAADPKILSDLRNQNLQLRAELKAMRARYHFILTEMNVINDKMAGLIEREKAENLDEIAELPFIDEPPAVSRQSALEAVSPTPLSHYSQQSTIDSLTPLAAKLLRAVVQFHPKPVKLRRALLIAGVSPRSSNVGKFKKDLVAQGYVEINGQWITATKAALAAVGDYTPFPTDAKSMIASVKSLFDPSTANLLEAIYQHPGLVKGALLDFAQISRTSSNAGRCFKELREYGLIEQRGERFYLSEEFS